MRVVRGVQALRRSPRRAVVTVGMFDGVHRGHQQLIRETVRQARRVRGAAVVVTFEPDPDRVLAPRAAHLTLTPLSRRLELIEALGVDLTWIIRFTPRFASTSAERFVNGLLIDRLRAARVIVGGGFAFGHDRLGSLALLRRLGARSGMRVTERSPIRVDGAVVSSSRIRRLIQRGDLEQVKKLLGRPMEFEGPVVHGAGRGKQLGFPTANVRLEPHLVLPPLGVYAVRFLDGALRHRGLMNLGVRPTFRPSRSRHPAVTPVCEVHVPGFRGARYGRRVRIQLLQFLRPERRFADPQALAAQIRRDVASAGF